MWSLQTALVEPKDREGHGHSVYFPPRLEGDPQDTKGAKRDSPCIIFPDLKSKKVLKLKFKFFYLKTKHSNVTVLQIQKSISAILKRFRHANLSLAHWGGGRSNHACKT